MSVIEITKEQHLALEQAGHQIARAFDRASNTEYVLLRAEEYDRLRNPLLTTADWPDTALPAAVEVFARDGWDDPRMDVYDALDPRREQ